MDEQPAVLDTDTLSELSRGVPRVRQRALSYLARFGRLTITAITVFERLRGYHAAIGDGRPFEKQLQAFEALVVNCVVLPFDHEAASVAATLWAGAPSKQRRHLGDILIAATAISRRLPVVTRNKRDFESLAAASGFRLRVLDWARDQA